MIIKFDIVKRMNFKSSSSHMDDFGPSGSNTTYMSNETYDNDDDYDKQKSYVFMIAFWPLAAAALFILIIFYLECFHFPIKKKINNCRCKYRTYFEQQKAPIVNNKLNKKYIDILNKSNKVILNKSRPQNLCNVNECAICIEVITNKEYNSKHSVVPDCGHCFHKTCLNKWVSQQSSTGNVPNCPVCRGDIVRKSDMKEYTVINMSYDSDSDSDTFSLSDY